MKFDMQIYRKTVKKIETELFPVRNNDNELLTYLMKQDSLTLNQMKMCLTEPELTFKHSIKIVFSVTLITLYIFFFSTHYNDLIAMSIQMLFVLIGLFWIVTSFPNAKRIQISQNFKQKSENTRIVGMIDFVLEQKYKKSISE
ncbi:hypothetical protein FO507_15915 [Bacillus mojavensis]|uniref:hypothetical protein n=1 Tax=Bacillus mojavensis TaxID=72360 RepID=UPI00028A3BE2|nr:hypothetical protein [Bacillus mojavensis]MDR4228833.1 hypothetical protein [Bacillus mojavensis]MEC3587107.1 hypothetical protein [Bacillus mojavensis]MEC5242297.1 hypothetical protein [Bacillus mojavensis]MED0750917.1 hypothetical protein [Bacillus mojavensis]